MSRRGLAGTEPWTVSGADVASSVIQHFVMRSIDRLSRTPIHVVYVVQGPAAADITYDTFTNGVEDSVEDTTALVPWTMVVNGHRPFGSFAVNVDVTSFNPGTTPVSCEISVNGHLLSRHTSVGAINTMGSVPAPPSSSEFTGGSRAMHGSEKPRP